MIAALFQVALGGALGSVCRFLLIMAANRIVGPGFAAGTLAVNVLGCFAIGIAFVMLLLRPDGAARLAPLVMAGFLGGFTTFSTFALDAWLMAESGRLWLAGAYVILSVTLSLAALLAGMAAGRGLAG